MHPQLQRYLEHFFPNHADKEPSWQDFLQSISQQWEQQDKERKLLEQALELSSSELGATTQELRTLLSTLPDMYFRINTLDRVLYYKLNDNCPFLQPHIQQGAHLTQTLTIQAYQQLIPALLDARRIQQPQSCEIQLNSQPQIQIYEARVFPLQGDDLLVLISDVSGRKVKELQFKQQHEWLTQQYKALLGITMAAEATPDTLKALQPLCQLGAQVLGITKLGVWLFDEQQRSLECKTEYDTIYKRFSASVGEPAHIYANQLDALENNRCLAVTDAQLAQAEHKHARAYLEEQRILSFLVASLRKQDKIIGVLRAYETRSTRNWRSDEKDFFIALADIATLILQKQHPEILGSALDESEARFKALAQSTDTSIFAFRSNIIYANGAMEKMTGFNLEALKLLPITVVMGEAFAEHFNQDLLNQVEAGYGRKLEIEFANRSGEVRWAFISVAATQFAGKLTWLASAFDITERKRAEAQLRYQAFHDTLTGLPNRIGFIHHIDQCLAKAGRDRYYQFALLYMDIDRFKLINDSLGHLIGDELLLDIALRLRKITKPSQVVARLSGDEFAILVDDIRSEDDAILMAERLLNEVRKPFVSDEQEILATASIGITLGDRYSEKAEHLLRNADIAMYQAKALGKNRYAIYDVQTHASAQRIIDIERDLRQRLRNNAFPLQFTPIINLAQGTTAGFDIDLRWQLDNYNQFTDDELRRLAVESGLINGLEDCLMKLAADYLPQFESPDLMFMLKIAGKSLADFGAIKRINQALEKMGGRSRQVAIQTNEHELVAAIQQHPQLLEHITRLQCKLILDKTGEGLSVLPFIHSLPLQALKITETILHCPRPEQGNEVLKGIINIGHNLGLAVIATGVKELKQLELLKSCGCRFAQGEYFSSAVEFKVAQGVIAKKWLSNHE